MLDPRKSRVPKRAHTVALLAAGALALVGVPLLYAHAGSDPAAPSAVLPTAGEAAQASGAPEPADPSVAAATQTRSQSVEVAAPNARVGVDRASGKVRVKAPYTDVRVDPDRGAVRVRAPYVDVDVHW